jgi:hypothetical protein
VFESFLTARMGVSVGRLPQEVLLEELYRSECSRTVRVGRVRVFEEFLAVFNCSVLTFGVQKSSIVNIEPRVRYIPLVILVLDYFQMTIYLIWPSELFLSETQAEVLYYFSSSHTCYKSGPTHIPSFNNLK